MVSIKYSMTPSKGSHNYRYLTEYFIMQNTFGHFGL